MKFLVNLLILCVGVFWIYDGIYRGVVFSTLLGKNPSVLVVSSVSNLGGKGIFPDYVAWGTVQDTNTMVLVHIFQGQFLKLERGSTLDVYPLKNAGQIEWINSAKLEESKPIMNILGFRFSWHLLAGLLMATYAVLSLQIAWRKGRQASEAKDKIKVPSV